MKKPSTPRKSMSKVIIDEFDEVRVLEQKKVVSTFITDGTFGITYRNRGPLIIVEYHKNKRIWW